MKLKKEKGKERELSGEGGRRGFSCRVWWWTRSTANRRRRIEEEE